MFNHSAIENILDFVKNVNLYDNFVILKHNINWKQG